MSVMASETVVNNIIQTLRDAHVSRGTIRRLCKKLMSHYLLNLSECEEEQQLKQFSDDVRDTTLRIRIMQELQAGEKQ